MSNIVKITDGLGNQMFQYAFACQLQKKTGCKSYLDISDINNHHMSVNTNLYDMKKNGNRNYGLDKFRIKLPVANDRMLGLWKYISNSDFFSEIKKKLNGMGMWPWRYIEENNLSSKHCIFPSYYRGYFFDLKYYGGIRKQLQRDFRLVKKISLEKELSIALKKRNTVAVHIRRGDFLKLGRDISEKGYYERAFDHINSMVNNPLFLVFSDEIEWVKKNMSIPGDVCYISGRGYEDYEEFAIMRACKSFIIANSTFSYWPAYLSEEGIVICPKRWKPEIIPEDWIRM